jgi:signal recognition particle subunit SRP54
MPKGQEKESQAKVKRMMCLMDSMTDEELDTTDLKMLQDPKRMERIGRGAGKGPGEVVELIEEYKRLAKMMGKMKGLKVPKKGGYGQTQALNQNLNQMASAIPPAMLKQMGGVGALQSMLKSLEGKDMGEMQKMMGKMMGGKGMPPGLGGLM